MDFNAIKHYNRDFKYTSRIFACREATCEGCYERIRATDLFVMCNWDTEARSEPMHLRCVKHYFPEGYWYIGRILKPSKMERIELETPFELSVGATHLIQGRVAARAAGDKRPYSDTLDLLIDRSKERQAIQLMRRKTFNTEASFMTANHIKTA